MARSSESLFRAMGGAAYSEYGHQSLHGPETKRPLRRRLESRPQHTTTGLPQTKYTLPIPSAELLVVRAAAVFLLGLELGCVALGFESIGSNASVIARRCSRRRTTIPEGTKEAPRQMEEMDGKGDARQG